MGAEQSGILTCSRENDEASHSGRENVLAHWPMESSAHSRSSGHPSQRQDIAESVWCQDSASLCCREDDLATAARSSRNGWAAEGMQVVRFRGVPNNQKRGAGVGATAPLSSAQITKNGGLLVEAASERKRSPDHAMAFAARGSCAPASEPPSAVSPRHVRPASSAPALQHLAAAPASRGSGASRAPMLPRPRHPHVQTPLSPSGEAGHSLGPSCTRPSPPSFILPAESRLAHNGQVSDNWRPCTEQAAIIRAPPGCSSAQALQPRASPAFAFLHRPELPAPLPADPAQVSALEKMKQAMQADSEFRELHNFPAPQGPHAQAHQPLSTWTADPVALHSAEGTVTGAEEPATSRRLITADDAAAPAVADAFIRKARRGDGAGDERLFDLAGLVGMDGEEVGRGGVQGGGREGKAFGRDDEDDELVVSCSPSGDRRLKHYQPPRPPLPMHPSVQSLENRRLVSQHVEAHAVG